MSTLVFSSRDTTTRADTRLYWAATALTAFVFFSGGIVDLVRGPAMRSALAALGYPSYFMLILGAWKVLGALAVVVPRRPRLKEWAYAGMFFDLSGAAFSHAAVGDPAGKVLVPLALLGIVMASWALRPQASGRVLPNATTGAPLV